MKTKLQPKYADSDAPSYGFSWSLLDGKTGASAVIEKNPQGSWDFKNAAARLKKLQQNAGKAKSPSPQDPATAEARLAAEKSREVYIKAKFNYKKSVKACEEAKTPVQKAKAKENREQCKWLYGMAYKKYEEKKDALTNLPQKKPVYQKSTSVGVAFGKSPAAASQKAASPVFLVYSKTANAAAPQTPTAKKAEPKKKVAAAAPKKPSPKAPLTAVKNVKAEPAKTPAPAVSAPRVFPPSSEKDPILVKTYEALPGNKVKVISSKDEILFFDKNKDKPKSHGNGLASVRLPDGRVIWLKDLNFKKEAAPAKPAVDFGEPAPQAKAAEPVAATPPPAKSEGASAENVSEAEAAQYTQPVPGYPAAKCDFYVWKHPSKNEYLAVNGNKRVRLGAGNFLSLDKAVHPENYAKVKKPS